MDSEGCRGFCPWKFDNLTTDNVCALREIEDGLRHRGLIAGSMLTADIWLKWESALLNWKGLSAMPTVQVARMIGGAARTLLQPSNRYPTPRTLTRYRGRAGSGSISFRRFEMWLSTTRSVM